MDTVNLLEETTGEILESGHVTRDVEWVGLKGERPARATWAEFAAIAKDIVYDCGYGLAEIDPDLVVQFRDGSWMERSEYDGSEWWEYKSKPMGEAECEKLTREMIFAR